MFDAYDDIYLDDLLNGSGDGVTCDDDTDAGRGFQGNDRAFGVTWYDDDGHKVDDSFDWS
jgi:hypothetical protein